MTAPAVAAPQTRRFRSIAFLSGGISLGMFLLGWVLFLGGSSLGDRVFLVLVPVAAVQMIAGGTGLAFAVLARKREGLHLGLTIPTALVSFVFGALGLLGIPLFLFLSTSPALGISGWGRPLRIRGKLVHPELRVADAWARGPRPDTEALDATTREVLAALWLQDAKKEYGSVPAFSRIGWQLAALGAPADLAERTARAGLQEIEHARLCFALVEGYLGRRVGVAPMPELLVAQPGFRSMTEGLRQVAVDSLLDGCLIEALNADAAAWARDAASDPAAHAALEIIARDERGHAELAWDILAFCLRVGGPQVARAVEEELGRLPLAGPVPFDAELGAQVARADAAALIAHGRVPPERWPLLFAHRRAATLHRARALLSAAAPVAQAA